MTNILSKENNKWKKLFPIFDEHPEIVYLDNAATTQKPKAVIQGVSDYIKDSYANIHRGLYPLSDKSEELYYQSKCALAELINAKPSDIIYTYNSTYCFNLLAQSLVNSKILGKGDKVLLGIWEHHSNILPRQTLSNIFGFDIEYINETPDFQIDWKDFNKKFNKKVKVVSFSHVSNVTGQIMDIEKVREKIGENVFFVVDGSQSVPHIPIDITKIQCDALIMTGHKMMAQTGLGMLYLRHDYIRRLNPLILGGGTIKDVSINGHSLQNNIDKREAGTPNIIGAVSLLKAIETINSIGGMESIWQHEKELINNLNEGFNKRKNSVKVIGNLNNENRIGTFSFIIEDEKNFNLIGELFAKENIYVRTGGHCAYPLHKSLNIGGSTRVSTYLYNTNNDIDKFFNTLDRINFYRNPSY